MRTLKETVASSVPEPEPSSGSPFLRAEQLLGYPLLALGANIGTAEWGERAYLHVRILNDNDQTEYTVSFSDKSQAYRQLVALIDAENKRLPQFPVMLAIAEWGKSYKLVEAPEVAEAVLIAMHGAARLNAAQNEVKRQQRQQGITAENVPF